MLPSWAQAVNMDSAAPKGASTPDLPVGVSIRRRTPLDRLSKLAADNHIGPYSRNETAQEQKPEGYAGPSLIRERERS